MRINNLKGGFRPNMKKKKLEIQNYDKELTMMIFWGWDIIAADESDDVYSFQLVHREDKKLRVYITLGRELQYAPEPYFEPMYQVYINDDKGEWDYRGWFRGHDLNYKNFWGVIEEVVDKYHPLIPF
jgi:hypothetical protein